MTTEIERRTRKAMRARWNKMVRATEHLMVLLAAHNPESIEGVEIADLRDEVEGITQAFHEFSAYNNSYQLAREISRQEQGGDPDFDPEDVVNIGEGTKPLPDFITAQRTGKTL